MSTRNAAPVNDRSGAVTAGGPLRVAVIDTDSGFLQVLTNRMDRLDWEYVSAIADRVHGRRRE